MSDKVEIVAVEQSLEEKLIAIEKAKVDLESAKIAVSKETIELEMLRVESKNSLLSEGFEMLHLNTARLSGTVDSESVEKVRTELYLLSTINPGSDIIVDINSPGGSVSDGMELFGIIRELSKSGHKMITRISGEACSMGGVIAQAGDIRQIREGSYLHLHEASWMAVGKASEMRESADYVERISKDISKIYAKRSTMTASEIYDRMHRREWWLSAEEALSVSFVDEIV